MKIAKQRNVAANLTHVVFEDMLRARTNLLGPTEYLQLSSGGSSNTHAEQRQGQSRKRAALQDPDSTKIKNVVKLELNER